MKYNISNLVKTTALSAVFAVSSFSHSFASSENVCFEGTDTFDEDKCLQQIQDMLDEDLDQLPSGYFAEDLDTIAAITPPPTIKTKFTI